MLIFGRLGGEAFGTTSVKSFSAVLPDPSDTGRRVSKLSRNPKIGIRGLEPRTHPKLPRAHEGLGQCNLVSDGVAERRIMQQS